MLDQLLPLVSRERNPELYASLISDLGSELVTLGHFDRALLLHAEALEMFSARGDEGRIAREFTALASIQLRSGNVEQALNTIENALPLQERAGDQVDVVAALRLAGEAAADLGRHETALRYLRQAEHQDGNGISIERTRVLIAGELRALDNLRGAERLLSLVLLTKNPLTRADALSERARLRELQRRDAEALADLREADSIYARLGLDLKRIDSSSALAMALLAAGDVPSASKVADTAVAMEARIRASSANPELRARFLSASYAPYEARIEADLARSVPRDTTSTWEAFRVAEGIRARSLADRLANAASPAGGVRIDESLAAVQAALPADTAVLAYFVGDRRSHGWLLTRSGLRHGVLPGRRALGDLVDAFVRQQRDGARTPDNAARAA
jgi:tetratricopeptide (TPR) repeat protein